MEKIVAGNFLCVNPEKCIGCGLCEFACSWEKEGTFNPLKSRIRIIHGRPFIHLAITCRQCEDTPCITACPRDALFQSEETGAILVDDDKCDGCKWCLEVCPYGAIRYEPEANTVVICDLCEGTPKCKEICPEEAIEFVTEDSEIGKAWSSATRKWIEASKNLVRMAEGKGAFNVLEDAEEIMKRVEEKYRELFAKAK